MGKKLVHGIGINDADYVIGKLVNGKFLWCPFYMRWQDMLKRCYNNKYHANKPTYIGCKVCDEWLTFSNFKRWMKNQDWRGKHLDKDLLVAGSKLYSPETCVFIDQATNTFTSDCGAARGEWPIGVYLDKRSGRFQAKCRNCFSKSSESLGCFTSPEQAHQAWKKRKHELACQLAELQTDPRVAEALRARYA